MSKLKNTISRIFRRTHPDIYQAAKSYAEEKGQKVEDVQAAALAAYLAADDEGKDALEKAMEESRVEGKGGGSSPAGIKAAIGLFKEVTAAMTDMFSAMNTARSTLSMTSMLADYKAAADAAKEIKKLGGEGGSGSLDDIVGNWFLNNMFGGKLPSGKSSKKPTGKAAVETHDDTDEKE